MKCPKCDYLGFETGDRCKNCGYDFSLIELASSEPEEPEEVEIDLTLQVAPDPGSDAANWPIAIPEPAVIPDPVVRKPSAVTAPAA